MTSTLVRQGKVRNVYDLGDHYLMVATDRISAFDWILPSEITDKGRVLNLISLFWFNRLTSIPNHIVSDSVAGIEVPEGLDAEWLEGRSMIVKKCEVVPIECVVRGYLVGSGWKDYQKTGSVCGIDLEPGLQNCVRFDEPIFTPATKAESGHDENISFEKMVDVVGQETAETLRDKSLEIYSQGRAYAQEQGLILADTKFEWGWHDGELILIDEVLTPDSSRYWPADQYQVGQNQPSFDKQFVREWLETTDWDKNSQPPTLPEDIVTRTRQKYIDAFEMLTKEKFGW